MEQASLRRGLAVQVRCLRALVLRDMMKRYGRANIGFLWVILEPMILTAGVMVVWSFLKPAYEHGIEIVSLVLTGYMPLTLWRHVTNSGVRMFQGSIGLLYHRNISLIDIFLARVTLELTGTTCALIFVYCVLLAAGLVTPIADIGLVIAAWLTMFLLSAGAALGFAILTEYSEVTERFVQPFQYLMLPLSGTFFMVEWLPTEGRELIWYNPTVHCFEMFRAGFFGESVTTHYTAWYPILCAVVLVWLGVSSLDTVRDRIHAA
jgi:capsular polysaccharide transport system permease protein